MSSNRSIRNIFGFVFTTATAGIVLVWTGLVGYQPPPHLDLSGDSWRRGVWVDGVIWQQVVVGGALLLAVGIGAYRINRRLFARGFSARERAASAPRTS